MLMMKWQLTAQGILAGNWNPAEPNINQSTVLHHNHTAFSQANDATGGQKKDNEEHFLHIGLVAIV